MVLTWVDGSESNTITSSRYDRNLFQTLGNLVDHLHEPTRRCVAALRHNQPRLKASGGAECREGDCVLVGGYLVKRRH